MFDKDYRNINTTKLWVDIGLNYWITQRDGFLNEYILKSHPWDPSTIKLKLDDKYIEWRW